GAVLLGAACGGAQSNTKLQSSWIDPNVPAQGKFNHVVCLAINRNEPVRRSMGNAMVQQIQGAEPSYTFITQDELSDRDKVREDIAKAGFDGVVVMRIVNVSNEAGVQTSAATAENSDLWTYYSAAAPEASDPSMQTAKLVSVETNVYSVRDGKLRYTSRSETANPQSVNELINNSVRANIDRLKDDKII